MQVGKHHQTMNKTNYGSQYRTTMVHYYRKIVQQFVPTCCMTEFNGFSCTRKRGRIMKFKVNFSIRNIYILSSSLKHEISDTKLNSFSMQQLFSASQTFKITCFQKMFFFECLPPKDIPMIHTTTYFNTTIISII